MAALDFPASPLIGDKYPVPAVVGQPQYTWDGNKWTTVGAQVTTAPPATALPLMDAATAVVGTATKYAREDHVHPKIPAAPFDALAYSGMQINGSFDVDQQNAGAVLTFPGSPADHLMDGWRCVRTGTSVVTVQQAGSFQAGYSKALRLTVTTAQPSIGGDVIQLRHFIEGYRITRLAWGTVLAIPLTIGFWVKSSVAGTIFIQAYNYDTTLSAGTPVTITSAGVAQFVTATFPAKTTGSVTDWAQDNRTGIMLIISIAGGGYNIAATVGNTFEMTGLVVLPGIVAPTAAQSPLIMRPFGQELITCKRYYWASYPYGTQAGGGGLDATNTINYLVTAPGAVFASALVQHPVSMRAAPTVTGYGASGGALNRWENFSTVTPSGSFLPLYVGPDRFMAVNNPQVAGDALSHRIAVHVVADARL